jgi:hypothetical protein
VDPEVVNNFNCLQQTGNFCSSSSSGDTAMSSNTSSAAPMGSTTLSSSMANSTISRHAAADALFALAGMQKDDLGSMAAPSPFHPDLRAMMLARHR